MILKNVLEAQCIIDVTILFCSNIWPKHTCSIQAYYVSFT